MLKRILASLALTSLVLAIALLVYWWRSKNGHVDGFTLGKGSGTESYFSSQNGRIALTVTNDLGGQVTSTTRFYTFENAIGCCLLIPGLWLAIWIRGKLPRPPGISRRKNAE